MTTTPTPSTATAAATGNASESGGTYRAVVAQLRHLADLVEALPDHTLGAPHVFVSFHPVPDHPRDRDPAVENTDVVTLVDAVATAILGFPGRLQAPIGGCRRHGAGSGDDLGAIEAWAPLMLAVSVDLPDADDPVQLRREITRLRRQLRSHTCERDQ